MQRDLSAAGIATDHIITLGARGMSDREIRRKYLRAGTVLLTQDADFLELPLAPHEVVIVSRIPQALPIQRRCERWIGAARACAESRPAEPLFEIVPGGQLVPWTIHPLDSES